MEEWSVSSTILDLGTRWRRVVSLTPWSLYPQRKSPQYICMYIYIYIERERVGIITEVLCFLPEA
jgi:hypothetical protein